VTKYPPNRTSAHVPPKVTFIFLASCGVGLNPEIKVAIREGASIRSIVRTRFSECLHHEPIAKLLQNHGRLGSRNAVIHTSVDWDFLLNVLIQSSPGIDTGSQKIGKIVTSSFVRRSPQSLVWSRTVQRTTRIEVSDRSHFCCDHSGGSNGPSLLPPPQSAEGQIVRWYGYGRMDLISRLPCCRYR
jgi:hypothetical protein